MDNKNIIYEFDPSNPEDLKKEKTCDICHETKNITHFTTSKISRIKKIADSCIICLKRQVSRKFRNSDKGKEFYIKYYKSDKPGVTYEFDPSKPEDLKKEKTCEICHETKNITHFTYSKISRKKTVANYCLICLKKKISKEYWKKNKDMSKLSLEEKKKMLEYNKKWRANLKINNPEKYDELVESHRYCNYMYAKRKRAEARAK